MDEVYPCLAGLTVVTEDLPRETNTVTLDPVLTDSDGIPAPKITYAVDDNTKKMIAHGEAHAGEALLAAGAVNPTCTIQALALYVGGSAGLTIIAAGQEPPHLLAHK